MATKAKELSVCSMFAVAARREDQPYYFVHLHLLVQERLLVQDMNAEDLKLINTTCLVLLEHTEFSFC